MNTTPRFFVKLMDKTGAVIHELFAKKNKQAAKNVLDDFEDTIKKLKYIASSLKVCDNPHLQSLGYCRINFQQHRYFMLYRIENYNQ